jgi:hypothetical protein
LSKSLSHHCEERDAEVDDGETERKREEGSVGKDSDRSWRRRPSRKREAAAWMRERAAKGHSCNEIKSMGEEEWDEDEEEDE